MSDGPRVALVVVNYRSAELTDRLLRSCAGGADETVVVDCTPDDVGLAEVAQRHGAQLVEPHENLGYGRAANLGARAVSGDVVVVANPDIEIDGASLRRLAGAARGVGLVAPRFTFPDGSLQRSAHSREPRLVATAFDLSVPIQAASLRIWPDWHPTLMPAAEHARPQRCRHVLGALMAVDRQAFDSVGGFDPSFFMYREETDLCRRLRLAGWEVRHDPSVEAVHALGGSTTKDVPVIVKPEHLTSHYHYIALHWGRLTALVARAVGALAVATSALTGPDRRAWFGALRWHLAPH